MTGAVSGHLVVAYHGCDFEVAAKVVSNSAEEFSHLYPSRNPYDWLGDGIYFFEDDFERAFQFARASADNPGKKYTLRPIDIPYAMGAVIRLGHVSTFPNKMASR